MKHLIPFLLLVAFTLTASCQEQADKNDKESPVETPVTETPVAENPTDSTSVLPPVVPMFVFAYQFELSF